MLDADRAALMLLKCYDTACVYKQGNNIDDAIANVMRVRIIM